MRFKDCAARIKQDDAEPGTEAPEDAGAFEAIVSVFGNVDHAGDVVRPGAFADTLAAWKSSGDPIPVWWSHRMDDPAYAIGAVEDAAELEPGDGRIPEWADKWVHDNGGLWVKGRIDTGADASDKAVATLRLLRSRRVTQFSYAYDVEDEGRTEGGANELRKIKLHEISPTPIGCNDLTELVAAKSRALKTGIAAHSTATSDGPWDGPANETRLPNEAGGDTYAKAYAWKDPDGDPDAKATYKFLHHEVSAEGAVGAANLLACSTGIGVLNGGRGGTVIPDGDREAVYRHLAAHLKDADREPPELKAAPAPHLKADPVLSSENVSDIRQAAGLLKGVLAALDHGDTPGEPAKREEPARAKREEPSLVRLRIDLADLEAQVS
jgi:HK97 family phage prohead protease